MRQTLVRKERILRSAIPGYRSQDPTTGIYSKRERDDSSNHELNHVDV